MLGVIRDTTVRRAVDADLDGIRALLVENGLPLRLVHLLQRHQRAGLLLVLQAQETLGQSQVLQGPRARYCTYFIYTIITYCTVLLRNPKRAVRRGFRPCFGFRRRARAIPKQGFLAFFGFVVRTLLWITWRRPAMPRHALRESPLKAVVLTNADVDHVAGLLNLRESQPLRVYATGRVLSVLAANSIFNVLNPAFVSREAMALDGECALADAAGDSLGFSVVPFAVPGKVALWLEDATRGPNFGSVEEDTVALEVRAAGRTCFFYIPGCARMTPALAARRSLACAASPNTPATGRG